ncbi:hypothetical protein ACF0H5_019880 [Mactra antiquata]
MNEKKNNENGSRFLQVSSEPGLDGLKKNDHKTKESRDRLSSFDNSTRKGKLSRSRKARSLYGVSPNCKFGPKGSLLDSSNCVL